MDSTGWTLGRSEGLAKEKGGLEEDLDVLMVFLATCICLA